MADLVLTRDRSSGRFHKRYRTEAGLYATLEGCNLDEAGPFEVVGPAALDNAEPDDLCRRCFPPGHESGAEAAE